MSRGLRTGALALGATLLLGGCGLLGGGIQQSTLPGGADVGPDPVTISADFEDVLDLVPQSAVKVDNVDVGRVSKITLNDDGRSARVEIVLRRDVAMPAGTTARLQQTSLLGEKYVAIVPPAAPAAGAPVTDGDLLPVADTSQAAQVEQVLGALSLVLNGGGIGQFQEISRELQDISADRPEDVKAFLTEMETFVSGLDENKEAITAAIDGLDRLSENLQADQDKIVNALEGLSPGLQVLVDQREQLVSMLESLDRLSSVSVETLDAAQDDIVADLRLLEPTLDRLAASGSALPESLQILLTYPFPDSVLGAIEGDYLNVFIQTNFRSLPAGCGAIGCDWPQITGAEPVDGAQPGGGGGAMGRMDPEALLEQRREQARSGGGVEAPPTMLPPTSSPAPGAPGPSVSVPTPGPGQPPPLRPRPSPTGSASVPPSTPPSTLPQED